jgi:hypothetical protein
MDLMPKLLRSKLEGQWLITEKCVVDQGSIKEVVSATTHMIHRYYFLLRAILTTFFAGTRHIIGTFGS